MRLNASAINSVVLGAFVLNTGLLYSEDSLASSTATDSTVRVEARLQGDVTNAVLAANDAQLKVEARLAGDASNAVASGEGEVTTKVVRLRDYGANWVYSGTKTAATIYKNGNYSVADNIFSAQARLQGVPGSARSNGLDSKLGAKALLRSTTELSPLGGLNTARLNTNVVNSTSGLHKVINSNLAMTVASGSPLKVTAGLVGSIGKASTYSTGSIKVTYNLVGTVSSCAATSKDGIIKERSLVVGSNTITIDPYETSMTVAPIDNTMVVV